MACNSTNNSNFNPRSLTGATVYHHGRRVHTTSISIPAPLRERLKPRVKEKLRLNFNPRSLTGATYDKLYDAINHDISIPAPLRERLLRGISAFGT